MQMIGILPRKMDAEAFYEAVEQRLCDLGQLVARQFPMTRRELLRGGKVCGIYFCVHGPRSVKLTAIADFEKKVVIYYGSDGIRRESQSIPVHALLNQAA